LADVEAQYCFSADTAPAVRPSCLGAHLIHLDGRGK